MWRCTLLHIFLSTVHILVGGWLLYSDPSSAQDPATGARSERKEELERQLKSILDELDQLKEEQQPTVPAPVPQEPEAPLTVEQPALEGPTPEVSLEDLSIISRRVQKRPEGLTMSSPPPTEFQSQPMRTMRESLESLPGVITRQANGPRDFSISIRGSGTKTTFAIRDIKVYEDGFIQTQSDGLSRLDIHDPWFMRSVEVIRGASSSLYDNYALGGMVHFRTRRGSDIRGLETFFSGGSFGYQKYGVAIGQETDKFDISMFGSHVSEDGYIKHSNYNTQTLNFNVRYK